MKLSEFVDATSLFGVPVVSALATMKIGPVSLERLPKWIMVDGQDEFRRTVPLFDGLALSLTGYSVVEEGVVLNYRVVKTGEG